MLLAGDVGGTHTRLALFDDDAHEPQAFQVHDNARFDGLPTMLRAFVDERHAQPAAACFGVAGVVHDGYADAVNRAWPADARECSSALGGIPVVLINDLEANARGIASLGPSDLVAIHARRADPHGNVAVVSAGTGLGMGGLVAHRSGRVPLASEGGHADFAPRGALQAELHAWLAARHGHVSWERVVSGPGLVAVYRFLCETNRAEPLPEAQLGDDPGAAITAAALAGSSAACVQALDLFVAVYGAAAGCLALTLLATGGVYLGGGIAPRIVERLEGETFTSAFRESGGRLAQLLDAIPIHVIMNDRAALLGAARRAAELARERRPTV